MRPMRHGALRALTFLLLALPMLGGSGGAADAASKWPLTTEDGYTVIRSDFVDGHQVMLYCKGPDYVAIYFMFTEEVHPDIAAADSLWVSFEIDPSTTQQFVIIDVPAGKVQQPQGIQWAMYGDNALLVADRLASTRRGLRVSASLIQPPKPGWRAMQERSFSVEGSTKAVRDMKAACAAEAGDSPRSVNPAAPAGKAVER